MSTVAVDVGGTFTDLVCIDEDGESVFTVKIPSTSSAPELAVVDAVKQLVAKYGIQPDMIERFVHGGTIGSNLFLGQIGLSMPKAALVTTRGFRDVLEIGRQNRSELYNVFFQRPKPLIPRKWRFEVGERIDANGVVLHPLDETELNIIGRGIRDRNVDSVAICFLNSYLNPSNERKAKDALSQSAQFVFASFEIDPEHREYERTSTTVVNAVLAPVISRYLSSTLTKLSQVGVATPIQLLSSSGGIVDLDTALRKPIAALESGPAAGVMGAAAIARLQKRPKVLSLDMGGTTAKAGCIVDYTPLLVPEFEVGGRLHHGRLIKGSGYSVRYPSVDLAEVSAGGGTVVSSDEVGSLKVGPLSAGATPGPACYGSGGRDPTITDANLILGRLGTSLLGGVMRLKRELASEAMERVAKKVRMSLVELAAASIRLVNLHMGRALDIVSLERGLDPREFALVTFGGAGPMHSAELAIEIGARTVIVPPFPGTFSALGMIMTDMKYSYVRGVLKPLSDLSDEFFEVTWKALAQEAVGNIGPMRKATTSRSVDARYLGQGFELEIEMPTSEFSRENLRAQFEKKHEAVYGYRHEGEMLEITAIRLTLALTTSKPNLAPPNISERLVEQSRKVWFSDGWLDTRILDSRRQLSEPIEGPAIIQEYDSTVLVPPTWRCSLDKHSCLIMERKS